MPPSAVGAPSPPHAEMPPLPDGPPPSGKPYQFGSSDRLRDDRNPHSEFSFRANPPGFASRGGSEHNGSGQRRTDHYTPAQRDPRGPLRSQQSGDLRSGRDRSPRRGRYNHRGGRGPKPATADRPLLRFNRGNTPEQMLGMNENQHTENRFLAIDDMSDSAEEPMDESDQDEYEPPLEIPLPVEQNADGVETKSEEAGLNSKEKALTQSAETQVTTEITAPAPKWSNPEYYTALPPPDESQRKKRDVVKLIRKARVIPTQEKDSSSSSQVVLNDDFISFEMGENDLQSENEDAGQGRGVPGAPSGPRSANNSANNNLKRKRSNEAMRPESFRTPKRMRVTKRDIDGAVLRDWVWTPDKSASPVPWVVQNHGFTEMPGFR
jgi:non-canonical poly(A) RNA polymerase PAPD5/7